MLSFKNFLSEQISKNTWTFISAHHNDMAEELIDLVDSAYKHTTLGSFVKSINDVKNSEWVVLDWNEDPKIDITIFFRKARSSEKWKGNKIQGVGHNLEHESKKRLMDKLVSLLSSNGWWIEASDSLAKSLLKRLKPITDQKILTRFLDDIVKFNDDGSYDRMINGKIHTEFIFGDLH